MGIATRLCNACLLLILVGPVAGLAAQTRAVSSQDIGTLRYFRGTWDCAGSFPASGKPIASTIRFDFDLGGKALVGHQDDVPPNAYHAIEVWVQKHGSDSFDAAIVDGYSGVREFHSTGWNGNTLTWQNGAGITPDQRFVYTRLGANTFRLDWEVSKDGTHYRVGDTLTCKRRKNGKG